MDLYANLGFEGNPFSNFSAEEEKTYLKEIYEKPRYYQTLLTEVSEGNSRYLFGERGIGKSALMYYLMEDLRQKNVFSILIDEYDGIPLKNNGGSFLNQVEQNIITKLGVELLCEKKRIKKLDKDERDKLAFLINVFFKTLGKTRIKQLYEEVSQTKKINFYKKIFNSFLIKPINIVLSGASNVVGSTISKALGLPLIDNNIIYQQFISEMSESQELRELEQMDYKDLKVILRETARLIEKLGYSKLVVFFDKIDEYKKLHSRIDAIADFLEDITTDTSLIYSSEFGFDFLLWNKLKEKMKEKQVRFDKSRPIDINWSVDELKSILAKRLAYFSPRRNIQLKDIVEEQHLEQIIQMASGSPRQLIMLLARIYEEQAKIDSNVNRISNEAVVLGMQMFSQTFEYELFFPRMSIKDVVNRILKVGKLEFTISDLAAVTKKSIPTASGWIGTMRNLGFVEEMDGVNGRAKLYKVVDPKIVYLLENKKLYIG